MEPPLLRTISYPSPVYKGVLVCSCSFIFLAKIDLAPGATDSVRPPPWFTVFILHWNESPGGPSELPVLVGSHPLLSMLAL